MKLEGEARVLKSIYVIIVCVSKQVLQSFNKEHRNSSFALLMHVQVHMHSKNTTKYVSFFVFDVRK